MADKRRYQALAVDLDGTLLNPRHQVDGETARALAALRREDIKIIVVTGRSLEDMEHILRAVDLEGDWAILQGGSVITRFLPGNAESDFCQIPPADRLKLIEIAQKYDFFPLFYIGEQIYTEPQGRDYILLIEEMMGRSIPFMNHLSGYQARFPVGKISMVAAPAILDQVEQDMAEAGISAPWGRSASFGTDICGRSKRQALLQVLQQLNIEPEAVVAVGDSDNDIEMVELAGLGVAMANATARLKALADYITDDNSRQGVAKVINTLMLGR